MTYPQIPRSWEYASQFQNIPMTPGASGVLAAYPEFSAASLGAEVDELSRTYATRDGAFRQWRDLADMVGGSHVDLETMVTNDARTLLSLSVFLSSTAAPHRSIVVGSSGERAERQSGASERAVAAWWDYINTQRVLDGKEPFQYDLAYWACLYGWYAVEYGVTEKDGEMVPFANPLNPEECFPFFAGGLERFVHKWDATLGEATRYALRYGVEPPGGPDAAHKITLADWWWRSPTGEVAHCLLAKGLPNRTGWDFVLAPEFITTLDHIPVIVGRVGGRPGAKKETGSVLYENEVVYRDFNEWLSFFKTIAAEHAKTPIVAHNIHLEEQQISPVGLRRGAAVVETDDPEARVERVPTSPMAGEVVQLLSIIEDRLQRGGYPALAYGGIGVDLSGFAISQLLQAAERRIGPQLGRIALIDSIISQYWLTEFKKGKYEKAWLSGYLEGNPRKSFVEEFGTTDVPKRFRVITEIPLRVGNDMMARMAIARQALGPVDQMIDHFTVLDELLQMDDPSLILERLARDAADKLSLPLRVAVQLKVKAAEYRKEGGEAAKIADSIDQMAEMILQQQQPAGGAPPMRRQAPNEMPPEAAGVSPDAIKAAMQTGVPNVRR